MVFGKKKDDNYNEEIISAERGRISAAIEEDKGVQEALKKFIAKEGIIAVLNAHESKLEELDNAVSFNPAGGNGTSNVAINNVGNRGIQETQQEEIEEAPQVSPEQEELERLTAEKKEAESILAGLRMKEGKLRKKVMAV